MFELTDQVVKKMIAAGYQDGFGIQGTPFEELLPAAKRLIEKRVRLMGEVALLEMVRAGKGGE